MEIFTLTAKNSNYEHLALVYSTAGVLYCASVWLNSKYVQKLYLYTYKIDQLKNNILNTNNEKKKKF